MCLGESTCLEPLCYPCKCPRPVHGACLARWQLHSAGSRSAHVPYLAGKLDGVQALPEKCHACLRTQKRSCHSFCSAP